MYMYIMHVYNTVCVMRLVYPYVRIIHKSFYRISTYIFSLYCTYLRISTRVPIAFIDSTVYGWTKARNVQLCKLA